MEDGVVYVEDLRWVSELGSVPMVVGQKNRGFRVAVNPENEGLLRKSLIRVRQRFGYEIAAEEEEEKGKKRRR